MFLKKHFGKLDSKVVKLSAGVLSVVMAAGAIFAGTSMKAGARSKTQDVLDELLGAAKPYGLVAEEFKNSNHNQTNFAVNTLHVTDQWLSAWQDKSVGTTYIRDFDGSSSLYMKVDTNAFNNLVLGSDFDYNAQENMYYIKDSNVVVDVRNCRDIINVFYDRDYMDVTSARESVADTFGKYADIADEDADIVIKADDKKVINLAEFSDKQIVVVNMYARNYTDGQENEFAEFYSLNDNFQIKNKANGQFVIINMLGADGDNTSFNRLNINGKGTGGLTDVDISDTVIFNAVNLKGNVEIAEQCGIIIAPYAKVKLTGTCNGRVIAKTFENVNGELHFISDAQEEETTAKETDSDSSIEETTPSVSENETTPSVSESENETIPSVSESENETTPSVSESKNETKPSVSESKNETKPSVSESKNETKPSVSESENETTPSVSESAKETKPSVSESAKETKPSVSESAKETKPSVLESAKETKPSVSESAKETKPSVSESTEDTKSSVSESTEDTKPSITDSTQMTKTTQGDNGTKPVDGDYDDTKSIKDSDGSKKNQVAADEDYIAGGKKAEVGADEELVQTGDNKHIGIYIGILVAAVIVSGIVIVVNRKKSDK